MNDTSETYSDLPDPPPVRTRRGRTSDESDGTPGDGAEPQLFEARAVLPGAVLMVPNRHWGFEVVSAADHPGACTHVRQGEVEAVLVKGTDADHVRRPRGYYFVEAGQESGLSKRTAFELVPFLFRVHRLKLFFPERFMGRLDEATLSAIRAELARLHPEE
jgi:hypothetical protein